MSEIIDLEERRMQKIILQGFDQVMRDFEDGPVAALETGETFTLSERGIWVETDVGMHNVSWEEIAQLAHDEFALLMAEVEDEEEIREELAKILDEALGKEDDDD